MTIILHGYFQNVIIPISSIRITDYRMIMVLARPWSDNVNSFCEINMQAAVSEPIMRRYAEKERRIDHEKEEAIFIGAADTGDGVDIDASAGGSEWDETAGSIRYAG